jgi:release factor glutamine methyltransferase
VTALENAVAALRRSTQSPRTDALLLLERVLGRSRSWIVAHGDAMLSTQAAEQLAALCERRKAGEPIGYILGSAGFYGREFAVDARVLIPRPETEHLVDEVVAFIANRRRADPAYAPAVLDVGVGCGAIACTVAAETGATVDATDTSRSALDIATANAGRLGVAERCRFHHGNLAEPVQGRRFDVVVANLPYVPTPDLPQAPDPASFEPRDALDGGLDGLALYRQLLPTTPALLKPDGLLLFESAPPTIHTLKTLTQFTLPNFAISVGHDYAGLARYIKAKA